MIYSQNRLTAIREDAEDYTEINKFYKDDSVKENTPSIFECMLIANKLSYDINSFDEAVKLALGEASTETIANQLSRLEKQYENKDKDDYYNKTKAELEKQLADAKKNDGVTSDKTPAKTSDDKKESKKTVDKEGLFTKISELLHKFVEAIKKLFSNITSKLTALASNDAKIIAKYQKRLQNWDKYSDGFEGVDVNVNTATKMLSTIDFEIETSTESVQNICSKYMDKVHSAKSAEEVNNLFTEFKNTIEKQQLDLKAEKDKNIDAGKNKTASNEDKFIPTQDQINVAQEILIGGIESVLKAIESRKSSALSSFKALEQVSKREFKSSSKEDADSLETVKAKITFAIARLSAKKIGSEFSTVAKLAISKYRVARKVFVTCGKYAIEQSGETSSEETTNTEESVNIMTEATKYGESSDKFLIELFKDDFTLSFE